MKLHADFGGKQVISNLFGSSVEDLHSRLIVQTPTQTSALSAPAYSKVARPQIDPHSRSWMTFMCPSADLSAGFILFLLCLLLWVLRKEVIWMSTSFWEHRCSNVGIVLIQSSTSHPPCSNKGSMWEKQEPTPRQQSVALFCSQDYI